MSSTHIKFMPTKECQIWVGKSIDSKIFILRFWDNKGACWQIHDFRITNINLRNRTMGSQVRLMHYDSPAEGDKLEILDFYREMNIEVFLNWLNSTESFFVWHNLKEGMKVCHRHTARLITPAKMWWSRVQMANRCVEEYENPYKEVISSHGLYSALTKGICCRGVYIAIV